MSSRVLKILHFNDLYHVDDFQGMSERAVRMLLAMQPYIEKDNPLVTFGGDLYAPSLMSSITKGQHMAETLELLGVHVATLGNHDFDFGIDRARQLSQEPCLFNFEGQPCQSTTTWIVSNITGLDDEPIAGAKRFHIQQWNGVKVGFIAVSENWLGDCGLSALNTTTDKYARWEEEVSCAKKWANHLREEGVDIVLCLCHDLCSNTERLAQEVPEVDFFLGGHEHLYQEHSRFIIAGFDFDDFCMLTFEIPEGGRPAPPKIERAAVMNKVPFSASELKAMPLQGVVGRMRKLVEHYSAEVQEVLRKPLGCSLPEMLDTRKFLLRTQETVAGNLFADAVFAALKKKGAECCLIISGMISVGPAKTPPGPLTLQSIIGWFPWEGGVCVIEVSGQTLLEALEHGCHRLPRRYGMFPQVSGMSFKVTVDVSAQAGSVGAPGKRVSDVQIQGEPLDLSRRYKVATGDYVADGGDDYVMFKTKSTIVVSPESAPLLHDAISTYLAKDQTIVLPTIEGRIQHVKPFDMHVESAEIGATPEDPLLEEIHVPASTDV